jgi:hypothetical protein
VNTQTDQLELLEPTPAVPKLTDRQAAVLDAVRRAGIDGLDADHAGAITHGFKTGGWAHGPDERCDYCGRDGNAVLKRLRELELVAYRRAKGSMPGGWVLTGTGLPAVAGTTAMLKDDEAIPF